MTRCEEVFGIIQSPVAFKPVLEVKVPISSRAKFTPVGYDPIRPSAIKGLDFKAPGHRIIRKMPVSVTMAVVVTIGAEGSQPQR